MIYELRIYECFAGKLPDLNARFRNHTMELFEKHGIRNVGYWTHDVGPNSNQLVYLVAFRQSRINVQRLGRVSERIRSGRRCLRSRTGTGFS